MDVYAERLAGLLRQYLGDPILSALADEDVEEIYVNPDMVVRCVSHSRGRIQLPLRVETSDVEQFLRGVASQSGTDIGPDKPSLAAALPQSFGKCRIQGFLPPISDGPALIIRKPPRRLIPLAEYVEQGILSAVAEGIIQQIVAERLNVIVAGPTASGKTTLCNAILAEISRQFPHERLVVLEDTPELRITGRDHLRLQTAHHVSMRDLVKYSLRCTPNRIIIGEVRDGAARDLLDAWVTGHPGGCGTVHGEDSLMALDRLARLAGEGAGGVDQRHMVAQSVDCVIYIAGHGRHRKVRDIARLEGMDAQGRFILRHESIWEDQEDHVKHHS